LNDNNTATYAVQLQLFFLEIAV